MTDVGPPGATGHIFDGTFRETEAGDRRIMGTILNTLKIILKSLKGTRVYVGRDVRTAPGGSVILFPLLSDTLACGLAGILTVKRAVPGQNDTLVERLAGYCKVIEESGVEKLLNRSMKIADYLGGAPLLSGMAGVVRGLKGSDAWGEVFFAAGGMEELSQGSKRLGEFIAREERLIETNAPRFTTTELEYINESMIRLKDAAWALARDLLDNAGGILFLAGVDTPSAISREGFNKYRTINLLINALDRLEVRGRDSAGVQVTVAVNGINGLDEVVDELSRSSLAGEWCERTAPGDLLDGSIQVSTMAGERGPATLLTFTYKKAAVTGELGENGRYLRDRIRNDQLFQKVISMPSELDSYMAHTRWASIGSITEENCHPINNYTHSRPTETSFPAPLSPGDIPPGGKTGATINVVLNGDIDNYGELRARLESEGQPLIEGSVTTDTKIIPLQIQRYLSAGNSLRESFLLALNDFEGSHAIAMTSDREPDKVFLALRGSGQSLYVGFGDDQFIYSSELYGIVEITDRFIKMDGETERTPGNPSTKGQVFVLDSNAGGTIEGINAFYYDGHELPLSDDHVRKAEITTRDIDRKGYPHYLLKEIFEAPLSARKTMRGKYHISYGDDGTVDTVRFNLGRDIVPAETVDALRAGRVKKIFVVGQGTAAVAGAAIAEALAQYVQERDIHIEAKRASELSGFSLRTDLNNALVIAVTQSGTTTDTNRAVTLAKERGARVIAIVNRRQSDITHVADGVFYTSDGRDIEMSVASTKAFYSQIVAGYILALYVAKLLETMSDNAIASELADLESAPEKMNLVIAERERIRESAWDVVKKKNYWAVVGSGSNKVAADEIRIKLSELCYKTISSDIVEDKKHIDLSSEPLIVVCAAGSPETVIGDIVKEVAIFKAHTGSVVVIADSGESRFDGIADAVLPVPKATFPTSVILNTLAGHIWGYYAACGINDDGDFFRAFRNRLALKVHELDMNNQTLFEKVTDPGLRTIVESFTRAFHERKNRGFFSSLSTEAAADIPILLKYSIGKLPLEDFWEEFRDRRVSSSPLDMLDLYLGRAIDELSRPIDAIRHQAKTVTVGTSRKGEALTGIIFNYLKGLSFSLENLTSRDGAATRRLQRAISDIRGYTLYTIEHLETDGTPGEKTTISIAGKGGISQSMRSRVEVPSTLSGTKRTIARTGEIYAGLGKRDKYPIVIMPLLGHNHRIEHVLLLHVVFRDDLTPSEKKDVLGDKFNKIRNLVNEYDFDWNDEYLCSLPIEFLLGEGVDVIVGELMNRMEGERIQ